MRYISTRAEDKTQTFSASDAILKGLCPDGGLFIPEEIPNLPSVSLDKGLWWAMYEALKPYFEGDELEGDLESICHDAFSFPLPFHENNGKDYLELYYGPTAAFKDFGARFLAFSMEKLLAKRGENLSILVATSGDTGGAVASAFHNREHLSVKVLFPKGRVAERQRRQLTGWDGNVESYEVDGSFDDCQRMVKEAFMDSSLTGLSSANSINLGRLLPQMAYYVYASNLYQIPLTSDAFCLRWHTMSMHPISTLRNMAGKLYSSFLQEMSGMQPEHTGPKPWELLLSPSCLPQMQISR